MQRCHCTEPVLDLLAAIHHVASLVRTGRHYVLLARGARANHHTPLITSVVPIAIQSVNGSSSSHTLKRIVDSGPIIPICEVSDAPIFSIAIMTSNTGTNVHSVAFKMPSQITSGATVIALGGRRMKNCAMHSTHAMLVASPLSRIAPSRFTDAPL